MTLHNLPPKKLKEIVSDIEGGREQYIEKNPHGSIDQYQCV
jgi:hypothetical protein